MLIVLMMFLLGTLFGFIGAGGAGFVIAVLTVFFGVPIHMALGTSLAAMAFTSISGAYSHYHEGNTHVKIGLIVGGFAAAGSFGGAKLAAVIPEESLHWLTAGMLFLSAFLLFIKLLFLKDTSKPVDEKSHVIWIKGIFLGLLAGTLSGTFGIGSAPFIQIGLMILLHLTIRQSVGTTMLVIVPLAIGGGIGYFSEGFIDVFLLLKVLIGTACGAYIGAKFTNIVPKPVLKSAIILTPTAAAVLLLF
ncbi:sulfite exporter TauE/SafE family protein [Domibacillus sp. A3M-37]|uniref:sulfite exporter TauE/SafE family protein n=1 Tax=Domibacillus sp. A3M-37 TaxID=2962037 RepID=UPI0020B6C0BE|nr:sulfite exporter TauE/SafE family protein [Domibacillus sp. A3M-37]MCP3763374.1 sulfite exporter TauE/SafE family protein [Domibacillus sp. A3M-37]